VYVCENGTANFKEFQIRRGMGFAKSRNKKGNQRVKKGEGTKEKNDSPLIKKGGGPSLLIKTAGGGEIGSEGTRGWRIYSTVTLEGKITYSWVLPVLGSIPK